jgi:hypothetical protein
MKWLLLILTLCGCSTGQQMAFPPSPSKARPHPVTEQTEFVAEMRMIRLGWGDCGDQPVGTYYEIFHTTNLTKWVLFDRTYNHFIDIPCDGRGLNIFKVRASTGKAHSEFGGYACPE